MKSVLGLNGQAGSGKDTISDFLIEKHGWSGKMSFARNLKDLVKYVFKLTEYDVSDHAGKKAEFKSPIVVDSTHTGAILTWMVRTHRGLSKNSPSKKEVVEFISSVAGKRLSTPREVLQFVGTDFCKYIIPSYHIDIVNKQLSSVEGNWIITDVRFPDEAQFIRGLAGMLVKIERPDLKLSVEHRHTSETALSNWIDWDGTFVNDAPSIEELYPKVDKFLEEINVRLSNNQEEKDREISNGRIKSLTGSCE